jgi:outer membrane protein TolC
VSSAESSPTSFASHSRDASLWLHADRRTNLQPQPATPTDVQWEEIAPLTLTDVIDLTLASNPDLVSASEQIFVADAALNRARADFYPELGIGQEYGVSNVPAQTFMYRLNQRQFDPTTPLNRQESRDNFLTQLSIEQNLYAGNRRRHQVCAEMAERDAAVNNLAAVQNQLVFDAAEAYYRLLQAYVLVGVREEAVKQVEQHLKIVDSRFRNETAVKSDVLSVEVRLAEVREAEITAKNQLELAWSVLENVIGSPIGRAPLPEQVTPAPWSEFADELEIAIGEAMNLRPELGVLSSQRQAAAEGIEIARSGKRIHADAVASYNVFTRDFRVGSEAYFLGLIARVNLFDGGRTEYDVEQAAARLRELRAREQRLMLDIELDVRRSHLQLVDARQRLEVTTQAIEQAGESLREIEVRYRGQASTITELIDAQVALSNARVRRANAEADVEIARASLQRAVGRLSTAL